MKIFLLLTIGKCKKEKNRVEKGDLE